MDVRAQDPIHIPQEAIFVRRGTRIERRDRPPKAVEWELLVGHRHVRPLSQVAVSRQDVRVVQRARDLTPEQNVVIPQHVREQ